MARRIVDIIKNLNWASLTRGDLEKLMVLSMFAAMEFAGRLRLCLEYFAISEEVGGEAFKEMAKGELDTDNLVFADYNSRGDHFAFLKHFVDKDGLREKYPDAVLAGERYMNKVNGLSLNDSIMSLVSRERELSGIFKKILEAKDWSTPALQAFRYYLERHIELDSEEGGHADLLSGFEVTDEVGWFWEIRFECYQCIPELFRQ